MDVNPRATRINHHTLTNHDFLSVKSFFLRSHPWSDECATDDSSQPAGADVNTIKEILLLAYQQNDRGNNSPILADFLRGLSNIRDLPAEHMTMCRPVGVLAPDQCLYMPLKMQINRLRCFSQCLILQHFPLRGSYPQKRISRDDLKNKGYLDRKETWLWEQTSFYFLCGRL